MVFCRASYLENLPFDLAIDQSRHNMVQLDQMSDLFQSDPAYSQEVLMNFKECRAKFGSPYQIEKALGEGRLFKMAAGIYSETGDESEIEVLQAKYSNTVVSFDSAYFYYDMTDFIPEKYTLTVSNHARMPKDNRIRLFFVPENVLSVGLTTIDYNSSTIRIYDKERVLIDTVRMKGRMPPDQYKEVINYFRRCRDELDGSKFPEYLELFPHRERIMRTIDAEVF